MEENQKPAMTSTKGPGPQAHTEQSLEERARSFFTGLKTHFTGLPGAQRSWLVGAVLFALLGAGAIAWYVLRTDWRTLYAGLDSQDAREMATQLNAASIPYDVSSDGSLLRVQAESLDKARLVTTAKGGPRSGRMGFDLFDKPNWVGSEFEEKVTYQRALEGELEHTIDTLSDVESARVHLVMPHDSLFHEDQRDAKASVVLKLRSRSLSEEEAEAIRNLVASAVDDLHPESVVLLDAAGQQLGRKSGSAEVAAYEQRLADKLIETLTPAAGAGNVHASVNVEYDTSSADEVDETYDPNTVVTLSTQRAEQNSGGLPTPSGVPGTASNAPNVQPPVYPKAASESGSQRQESDTYAASKKTRHVLEGAGRLQRLTAAVLINQQKVVSGKKVGWQARPPEEMRHLTDLAQAAVGFDASRGDVISVQDLPFEDESTSPVPIAERLLKMAGTSQPLMKLGVALLGMIALLVFVVRPLMRKVQAIAVPVSLAAMNAAALAEGLPVTMPDPALIEAERQRKEAQEVFESVTEHLRREPAQTTRLLQSWIHTE